MCEKNDKTDENIKEKLNRYCVFTDKTTIMSKCQFFPSWWIDLMPSQRKSDKLSCGYQYNDCQV